MTQGGEAYSYKEPYHPDEEPEPQEAVVHYLPKTYEAYKNLLGGILSQEEYDDVKSTVGDNKWAPYARSMAAKAGITLLPDETIDFYKALCDKRSELGKERPEMSDHQLLAEAFRIEGDKDSLATFEKSRPHF